MPNALQTRVRRPLIFLAVVLCHCLILVALLRTVWSPPDRRRLADDRLILLLLPRSPAGVRSPLKLEARAAPRVATTVPQTPLPSVPSLPSVLAAKPPEMPANPSPPAIDWEHEAVVQAERSHADADREHDYRNLAGLTPERRAWLENHHMEPVPPEGMHWAHPRVEIVNGLPLIWVNNHCVAVPLMMLLVFCSIGHIEPRGDLLDHMREADEARARSLVP